MKKIYRTIAILFFSPFVFGLFFLGYMSIKYTPQYVYRTITLLAADVYDYQYFDNRVIQAEKNRGDQAEKQLFKFPKKEDASYIESLFEERVAQSGFSSFDEWADKSETTALLVIRRDTLLYEKYFNGFSRDSYFHSQSVAKSFIGFLIGAAIDEGLIKNVTDPITEYIPELKERDPRFEKITLKHVLEMRSGLSYDTSFLTWLNIQSPWKDEVVGYYHPNVRKLLLEDIEIARAPGAFEYNNYNTSYLGLVIERTTGKTVSRYLEEKLWSQIMEYDALFSIDSKASGFEYMPSRLIARAIDYARFGRLYLNNGVWEGKRIISENWVQQSTLENKQSYHANDPDWIGKGCAHTYYGYQWWGSVDCEGNYQYFANGNLGQNIYLIPDKEIIIVHCGNSLQHYSDSDLMRIAEKLR